eukprot:gene26132-34172_t
MLNSIGRVFNFIFEDGAMKYCWSAGKPSLASYRMCRALKALGCHPRTVFDVGANQGQFAGASAWWFPEAKIVSFEPSPTVFRILQRNTSRVSTIECVQSAVGDRRGELKFFESDYSHASSALPVTEAQRSLRPETAKTKTITVPVTTLDVFAQGKNWSGPILLKLDVQGFEKKVLEGATAFLPKVDYLLFECSYQALYENEPLFAEMYTYVQSLGYELVAPVGFLENEEHVLLQTDLLWRRRR